MEQFLSRHQKSIVGVLSGFDRMIFRGTLRSISYVNGMDISLSAHKILLKDFGSFVQRHNPLLQELNLRGYYWTLRQGEYATDIIFKDPSRLRALYPILTHHAIEHFSCEDVLRFLGRKTNSRFSGEVQSEIRKRPEGTRIKHWVEENSIKMYDKQGCVLRIETTINNPRRFKVYRETHRHGQKTKGWIPMRKSIADIYRRVEVSRQANTRYLEALSVIGDQRPSYRLLDSVAQPVRKNNHRHSSSTSKLYLKTLSKKRNLATLYDRVSSILQRQIRMTTRHVTL